MTLKRWPNTCLGLAITIAVVVMPSRAGAQTLQQQVVGTWLAVSQYVDQDGRKVEPFGSSPKGMVVYDAGGRFSLVLQRSTLPRFASNDRMTGTALHYDGSTYPNWDGEDQVRLITISGDELQIVSPVSAIGGGVVHLVLRRAR